MELGQQQQQAETWAKQLASGELSPEVFSHQLQLFLQQQQGIADTGSANVDLARAHRCGFPEVVYAPGKTTEALEKIFQALLDAGTEVLATRVTPEQAAAMQACFPTANYNVLGRTLRISPENHQPSTPQGRIAVITAGTSDLPVGEEARETALWMGCEVEFVCDVGVAGPHRLPQHLHKFEGVAAVVVVAGMEGALPSVVGGHVACPVIAVPTSVGYGASLGGIAALLSMLNSCAANVTVVNIDAGFKGGYLAGMIANAVARK